MPETVGIALSGGGHRATAFGLGALLYLVDAGLHRKVTAISSVSGGSILNAYLAVAAKPFSEIDSAGFDALAGRIAQGIAGKPARWRIAAWLGFVGVPLASVLMAVNPQPWWFAIGLCLAVGAIALGTSRGGTLWGWYGTWVWALALCAAAACMVGRCFVLPAFGVPWWIEMLALLGAAIVLTGRRSQVVDRAIRHSLGRVAARSGSARLEDMTESVRHVICATEMHGGQHFYFCRDFVYSPGIGVGKPGRCHLSTAVQASASYPGLFPFRTLRSARFAFSVWDMKRIPGGPTPDVPGESLSWVNRIRRIPRWLMLSDGGVFDNLGVSWFLGGHERAERIDRWVIELANHRLVFHGDETSPAAKSLEASIRLGMRASAAMWEPPSSVLVINAGLPPPWKHRTGAWMALASLAAELFATTNTMYSNTQIARLRELQERFSTEPARGAVVDISEVGVQSNSVVRYSELDLRWGRFLESLPWPRTLIDDLGRLSRSNVQVATTLQPLGPAVTADLLQHGYLQAMASLHVRLGTPLLPVPPRERFERLVA